MLAIQSSQILDIRRPSALLSDSGSRSLATVTQAETVQGADHAGHGMQTCVSISEYSDDSMSRAGRSPTAAPSKGPVAPAPAPRSNGGNAPSPATVIVKPIAPSPGTPVTPLPANNVTINNINTVSHSLRAQKPPSLPSFSQGSVTLAARHSCSAAMPWLEVQAALRASVMHVIVQAGAHTAVQQAGSKLSP